MSVLLLSACLPMADRTIEPATVRLVDAFPEARIQGDGLVSEMPTPTVWSFGEAEAVTDGADTDGAETDKAVSAGLAVDGTQGWEPVLDMGGLVVEDGRLRGRSTGEFPVLHVELPEPPAEDDLVYALEIRVRVSAGANLQANLVSGPPQADRRRLEGVFPWAFSTPLQAGEDLHTYVLKTPSTVRTSERRHLLLRPTDTAGAAVEIESVRLVYRREHLLSVPTGIGWHGMGGIYHESIVSRAGDTVSFDLTVPRDAWLDLSVATLGDMVVNFDLALGREGGTVALGRETVREGGAWQPLAIDLSRWAGDTVTLQLTALSGHTDALGFWGSPVVRSRYPSTGDDTAASAGTGRRGPTSTEPFDGPKGVIVVLADTLRRGHLDAYGYERPTAPNLSQLAAEGALAEDPISQSSWTKLSVTSIFTSLYPSTHGVLRFNDRLPASAETLAEVFRDAGYATLGLSSVPFTGKATNMQQGYEEFHETTSLERNLKAKTARHYVDRLLPWLETHKDSPFFVFLQVFDPHSPYEPYEPYDTFFGAEGDLEEYIRQRDAASALSSNPLMSRFGMPKRGDIERAGFDPEQYVAYQQDAYDGSIRAMDDEFGRLIDHLKALGLEKDVVVAVVSDHGTEFLDHGDHFHGHTVYGELNQVPMLFWAPGRIPAGTRIQPTVETLDLFPTVLELAGLPIPEAAQGQSLVPLMGLDPGAPETAGADTQGAEPTRFRPRPAVTETIATAPRALPEDRARWSSLIDGDWKLVRIEPEDGSEVVLELFDRTTDPYDQNDVSDAHPEVVERLDEALAAWRQRAEAARLASDEELAEGLSAEELERLRSLGYV